MRRIFGWIVTLLVIGVVTLFSVNNREAVGVELWPLPWAPSIPLFLLTLLLILFGFLFGVVVMWFTGAKRRRQLRTARRELEEARVELHDLRRRAAAPRSTGTALSTTQTRLPAA